MQRIKEEDDSDQSKVEEEEEEEQEYFKPPDIKIVCFIGEKASGKTTLINRTHNPKFYQFS